VVAKRRRIRRGRRSAGGCGVEVAFEAMEEGVEVKIMVPPAILVNNNVESKVQRGAVVLRFLLALLPHRTALVGGRDSDATARTLLHFFGN
jgi:hypothetical protein